jgi:type VI secretion system protein
MPQERLLKRISNHGRSGEQSAGANSEIQSLVEHFQRLLNTRQGSVLTLPDYGIPDFSNVPGETLTEAAVSMENALKQVLLKYEPRLSKVQLTFIPQKSDILRLHFKIDACLSRDPRIPVSLETVVSTEGRVDISD